MSDWWSSRPDNSGAFRTFDPHWRDPRNGEYLRRLPPAGWSGTYRPHWQHPSEQNRSGAVHRSASSRGRICMRRAGRRRLFPTWGDRLSCIGFFVLLIFSLSRLDTIPAYLRWIGL